MGAQAQAVRAHLNMLLLAVLERDPLHAYAVREALREGSGGRFDLSDGTVYPALRRLEHLGLVTSSWSVVDGRHLRIYRLTPAGRDKLSADRNAWREFVAAITGLLESLPSPAPPASARTSP